MKVSQTTKLFDLLSDGEPHSTIEIMKKVYGGSHLGIARIGARIHDLRSAGHEITGLRDDHRQSIYWYKMQIQEGAYREQVMNS